MNALIYIGEDIESPIFTFDGNSIISVNINSAVDLLQSEMRVDTAEVVVYYDDEDETLRTLAWETPVWIYSGNDLIGKFYSTSVKRISRKQYEINTISYVGFLDDETFYGGVYDAVSLPTVIEQIVKTDGLSVFNSLASLKINRPNSDGEIRGESGDTWFDRDSKTGDMRNGMYYKFRFNGFHNEDLVTSTTTWYAPLCGFTCKPAASTDVKNKQYGVYGLFTRSSTSSPFPDTTELFFRYMQQEISIGTPSIGDVIEIECVPTESKVTINGVEHSITPRTGQEFTTLDVIGGGRFYHSTSTVADYDHHVNLEVLDYEIRDYSTGNIIIDFLPLLNTKTNEVYYRNGVYGGQFRIPCASPDNVEFLDVEAPGVFPHNYRDDFVNSIGYSPEARNYRVSGWIPICTKREAIHQILLPSGISLKKDADGNWLFSEPSSTIVSSILENNTFGNGNIEYSGDVNEITVKEHFFKDTSASVTEEIYSAEEETEEPYVAEFTKKPSKIGYFAYYPEPGWLLDGENFIYAWCENAALINGSLLKIEGYPYEHKEKIYIKKTDSGIGTSVSVEDVTTITPDNSSLVLQRLENYYLKSHTCTFDIVRNAEKCGSKYSFTNPFNEEDSGFLVEYNEKLSSFSKAQCKFLCDYDPIPLDNGYNNYVLLTGSGTWQVPEEVFEKQLPKIRAVLIGGGNGGFSGLAGENGEAITAGNLPSGGSGGEAGDPGDGGKIFDVTINNPSATYSYSCGTGGAGANTTTSTSVHNTGSQGTASTFSDGTNTYTSQDGESKESGHTNFLSGAKYALKFSLPGWKEQRSPLDQYTFYGKGGDSGQYTGNTKQKYLNAGGFSAYVYNIIGDDWETGNYWGSTSSGDPYPNPSDYQTTFQKGGGCGGGSGVGERGEDGKNATSSKAGDGGNGGNALWIPPKATDYDPQYYGYGGHGGGGGGAGGASGYLSSGTPGTPGSGGYGGCGGVGGDGCILIYY